METKTTPNSPIIDEEPASPIDMTTRNNERTTPFSDYIMDSTNHENDSDGADFEVTSSQKSVAGIEKDLIEPEDILAKSILEVTKTQESFPTSSPSFTKPNHSASSDQNFMDTYRTQMKQNFSTTTSMNYTSSNTLESTMLAQKYNQCFLNKFFAKHPQQTFYNPTTASPLSSFPGFRTPMPLDLFGFPRPVGRTAFNGLGGFVSQVPLEQEVSQLKMCLQRINKEIQDLDDSSEESLEASKSQLKTKLNAILEFSQSASAGPTLYSQSMMSQQQAFFQTVRKVESYCFYFGQNLKSI